jgi:hypothetical protein
MVGRIATGEIDVGAMTGKTRLRSRLAARAGPHGRQG